jgi:hypothetical protein
MRQLEAVVAEELHTVLAADQGCLASKKYLWHSNTPKKNKTMIKIAYTLSYT